MRFRIVLLMPWLSLCFSGALLAQCDPRIADDKARSREFRDLLKAKDGGLVIVLRHTTKETVELGDGREMKDGCLCPQEVLSEFGEKEALWIRSALASLKAQIPLVLHSEFCRTKKTATLIFGEASVTAEAKLNLSCQTSCDGVGKQNCNDWLKEQLKPAKAGNTKTTGNAVLVTHSTNMAQLGIAGLDVQYGTAAVFIPSRAENKRYLGCLLPEDWKKLLPDPAARSHITPALHRTPGLAPMCR